MPRLINAPTRIAAAGTKPKLIDEYVGRVNTQTADVSIAHMRSPGGWSVVPTRWRASSTTSARSSTHSGTSRTTG